MNIYIRDFVVERASQEMKVKAYSRIEESYNTCIKSQ
jgi:hypothetical protein